MAAVAELGSLGNLSRKEIEVKSQGQVESGSVFSDIVFLRQIHKVLYETNTIDQLGNSPNRAVTFCGCCVPVTNDLAGEPVLDGLWHECHATRFATWHPRRSRRQASFENSARSLVRCGNRDLSLVLVALYTCI